MRARLLAAMTAAVLISVAAPFLSPAANAAPDHKCDRAVTAKEKCDKTRG